MNLTINVDASYHPEHKVGAYAFWIVCDQGKILHTGPLKSVASCTEAEMQGIGNAFHAVLKSNFTGVSTVVLNCDCQPAMKQIFGHVKRRHPMAASIQKIIHGVGAKYELGPAFKWVIKSHVKAHSGKDSARKWVNDWCDRKAREQMRQLVLAKWLKK